jgi:hypothetical protein
MAFRKDKTTAAQTAANVAGNVAAAALTVGAVEREGVVELVLETFDALFSRMSPIVEEDNAGFAAAEAASPAPAASARSGKTGGGSRGNGNRKPDLEFARTMTLKGGAFGGVTLEGLLDIDAETAEAEYGYGDGERGGREYLSWLASDKNTYDYTRERARLVADAEGVSY